jgi:transcriptional regulator of acetoin/glycerol metabolism
MSTSPWLAWPAGTDPDELSRSLYAAHESFLETGKPVIPVRSIVLESWRRSMRSGVNPDVSEPPVDLLDDDLRTYREAHPLAAIMPVVRRLLVTDATDSDLLVAVTDASGRMLWVEGAVRQRIRAEGMRFVEGASWGEGDAGTNAPGTALAVDHSVQIFASEHFSRPVHPWSCSAAPVHDPETGDILGAIDITGGDQVAAPHMLTLVRATAAAAEAELRLRHLMGRPRPPAPRARPVRADTARLDVLGRTHGTLRRGGQVLSLSARHSELLLLLATHPDGRSAEQLAVELHERESALVTIRAEMSRLRRLLGDDFLTSRPYRITVPVDTDVAEARRQLDRGAHRLALEIYQGAVLPQSQAPGVVAIREELRQRLRTALLRHATADVLLRYAESVEGRTDVEVWRACLAALPIGSPRRTRVQAHLHHLDATLA